MTQGFFVFRNYLKFNNNYEIVSEKVCKFATCLLILQ